VTNQPLIVVNYTVLGQSASSLREIGDEFEQAARIKDHLVGSLGSGDIADAMGEFSGNWNRKRAEVTQKIKDTEGVVRSVMASFSEQDRNAAKLDLSYQAGPVMTTTETAP
jgi:hypothetical protein